MNNQYVFSPLIQFYLVAIGGTTNSERLLKVSLLEGDKIKLKFDAILPSKLRSTSTSGSHVLTKSHFGGIFCFMTSHEDDLFGDAAAIALEKLKAGEVDDDFRSIAHGLTLTNQQPALTEGTL